MLALDARQLDLGEPFHGTASNLPGDDEAQGEAVIGFQPMVGDSASLVCDLLPNSPIG